VSGYQFRGNGQGVRACQKYGPRHFEN
jgi:hypothetical protein